MTTRLENLLDSIDPAKTIDQVATRLDDAINSFQVKSGMIQDWEEFKTVLADFHSHLQSVVLRVNSPRITHPEIDWGRCSNILRQEYGHNGEKAAFEMVRTGSEGGLYAVLNTVGRRMADEYAGNEISARAIHFWDSLSTDEKLSVSNEYLEKYGHLLPSELTEGSAARVRANFLKVLQEHPRIVKRMRSIGRSNY